MAAMMKTNPGLKDRFPLTFHFDDYSAGELMEMAYRTLEAGKVVNWNGAVKAEDEKIEIVMVKENKKQYSEYFGEVTQTAQLMAK